MNRIYHLLLTVTLLAIFGGCKPGQEDNNRGNAGISDDSLLTLVQYRTFQYFWDGAEPNSGMARERFHMNGIYPRNDKNIVTSGGSGFGLMAIISGIERGFVSRDEGLERFELIIGFLENADRFHGAWPHWFDGETGKVSPFSRNDDGGDIVETAFLVQGLLAVKQYLNNNISEEDSLGKRIDKLWHEVEWDWYQKNGEPVIYWHWSPNYGWEKKHRVQGYNECLITYILGVSSPSHPVDTEAYHIGWTRNGDFVNREGKLPLVHYGHELGGPLFWAHYSFLGLDPRGLSDKYADYWEHNVLHVKLNRQYCIDNPLNYKGYGEHCWGLTSSYTIRDAREIVQNPDTVLQFKDDPDVGYAGHSPKNDFSVIAPTAALSSIPYMPEESIKVMRYLYEKFGDKLLGPYGFYDAFSEHFDWFPRKYLAIDQGPTAVMIENYRTGLLWELFMSDKDVLNGLKKLGFTSPYLTD